MNVVNGYSLHYNVRLTGTICIIHRRNHHDWRIVLRAHEEDWLMNCR